MAKICPLIPKVGNGPITCIEDKCAWWCKDTENCCICEMGKKSELNPLFDNLK